MLWVIQDKDQMEWNGTGQQNGSSIVISSTFPSACLTQKWTNKDILCSMLKIEAQIGGGGQVRAPRY